MAKGETAFQLEIQPRAFLLIGIGIGRCDIAEQWQRGRVQRVNQPRRNGVARNIHHAIVQVIGITDRQIGHRRDDDMGDFSIPVIHRQTEMAIGGKAKAGGEAVRPLGREVGVGKRGASQRIASRNIGGVAGMGGAKRRIGRAIDHAGGKAGGGQRVKLVQAGNAKPLRPGAAQLQLVKGPECHFEFGREMALPARIAVIATIGLDP